MPDLALRWAHAAGIAAALVLVAASARAQSDEERLGARAVLLRQAEGASDAGDHAAAIDLARRAARIQWTPSLRRFLADELAASGDPGAAYGMYQACIREANAGGGRNRDHAEGCHEAARRLEAHIGLLRIDVGALVPAGLAVTIGTRAIDAELLGTPIPVTPGRVEVTASAPGHRPSLRVIDVAERRAVSISIRLEAVPARPEPTPAEVPAVPVVATPSPVVPPAPAAAPLVPSNASEAPAGPATPEPDLTRLSLQLTRPPRPTAATRPRGGNTALIVGLSVAGVIAAGAVAGGVAYWALDRTGLPQPGFTLPAGYYSSGVVSEPSP